MNLSTALHNATETRWADLRCGTSTLACARRVVELMGPDRPVSRINDKATRQLARALEAAGLGPASVNRHLSALRALLEAAGVRPPAMPWRREPRGRTRWLSDQEITELAEAIDARFRDLVLALADTGCRVGELIHLAWEDVHAEHVTIRRAKNGEDRRVLTTARVRAILDARPRDRRGPFAGLSQSALNHAFRAARETLPWARGDKEIVPHALRHTCASRLVAAGASLPVIQAWLGHRDPRSTSRYAHVGTEALRRAVGMLEGTDARV